MKYELAIGVECGRVPSTEYRLPRTVYQAVRFTRPSILERIGLIGVVWCDGLGLWVWRNVACRFRDVLCYGVLYCVLEF